MAVTPLDLIKFGKKKHTHTKQQTVVVTENIHYKACTLAHKLVNNSAIIACLNLFLFEFSGVSTPNLGKPSDASTCCHVT